jgi:hypothetical protein
MTDTRPESQVAFLVSRGMAPERARAVVADLGPDLMGLVVRQVLGVERIDQRPRPPKYRRREPTPQQTALLPSDTSLLERIVGVVRMYRA